MKKLILVLALLSSGAWAQNVPNHAIPIGRGPGVVGWGTIACAAYSAITQSSTSTDPICTAMSGNASKVATVTGSLTNGHCLEADAFGNIVDLGSPCGTGSGSVTQVANSDGTLTFSPNTGNVVGSLALGHANTWTATQTFPNNSLTNAMLATMPADTVKCNNTSSSATPSDCTSTVTSTAQGVCLIAPGINGVVGNGVANDTTAVQSILTNCANPTFQCNAGAYLISTTLTLPGTSGLVFNGVGPTRYGTTNGCSFIAAASFTGTAAMTWTPTGMGTSNEQVAAKFSGFSITNKTAGSGPTTGLSLIGSASGLQANNNNQILVENVVVSGFAVNFLQQNLRLVMWLRTSAWQFDTAKTATSGELGYDLQATASSFVGDTDFVDGQVTSSSTGTGVSITDNGAAGATSGGVRFRGFVFYDANLCLHILASGGGTFEDYWLTSGTQFQDCKVGVFLDAENAGSQITDFHSDHAYFVGSNQIGAITSAVTSNAAVSRIFIDNSIFLGFNNSTISIDGTNGSASNHGLEVNYNMFAASGVTATGLIWVKNYSNLVISGNVASDSNATAPALVQIATGGDWFTITNNNSGGTTTSSVVNGASNLHNVIQNNQ